MDVDVGSGECSGSDEIVNKTAYDNGDYNLNIKSDVLNGIYNSKEDDAHDLKEDGEVSDDAVECSDIDVGTNDSVDVQVVNIDEDCRDVASKVGILDPDMDMNLCVDHSTLSVNMCETYITMTH